MKRHHHSALKGINWKQLNYDYVFQFFDEIEDSALLGGVYAARLIQDLIMRPTLLEDSSFHYETRLSNFIHRIFLVDASIVIYLTIIHIP